MKLKTLRLLVYARCRILHRPVRHRRNKMHDQWWCMMIHHQHHPSIHPQKHRRNHQQRRRSCSALWTALLKLPSWIMMTQSPCDKNWWNTWKPGHWIMTMIHCSGGDRTLPNFHTWLGRRKRCYRFLLRLHQLNASLVGLLLKQYLSRKNSADAREVWKSCVYKIRQTSIVTVALAGGSTISIITGDHTPIS